MKVTSTHNPHPSLYLLRHGETEWNVAGILQGREDSPLTQRGRAQAKALGTFLKNAGVTHLYASPLGRVQQTILEAKQEHETLSITLVEELVEIYHGSFEGVEKSRLVESNPEFWKQRDQSPHHKLTLPYPDGGESYLDAHNRIKPFVDRILAQASEGTPLAFIAHEGINRMVRGYVRGLAPIHSVDLRQPNNVAIKIATPFTDREELVTFHQ
jgi:broad specificity phosphatase PhoE